MCILKSFGSISVASMKWCFEILFKIFSTSFISRIWLTVLFNLNGSQNVIDIKLTFFCDDRKCFVSVRHAWDKKSKKKQNFSLVQYSGLVCHWLHFILFFFFINILMKCIKIDTHKRVVSFTQILSCVQSVENIVFVILLAYFYRTVQDWTETSCATVFISEMTRCTTQYIRITLSFTFTIYGGVCLIGIFKYEVYKIKWRINLPFWHALLCHTRTI